MADAVVLEEFNYAMAEGDVGRVYEAMKVCSIVCLLVFSADNHMPLSGAAIHICGEFSLQIHVVPPRVHILDGTRVESRATRVYPREHAH